ncbi:MAG TPA: hypothetical protein VF371_11435 [Candidatus Limnocylindrales bacterium]
MPGSLESRDDEAADSGLILHDENRGRTCGGRLDDRRPGNVLRLGVVDSSASFVSVPSGALVLTTNSGTLSTTLGSTDTYTIELKAVRSSQSQTGNTTVTVNP